MTRNQKIFLASGVPFGTVAGILCSALYGISAGLTSGLFAGAFFGFLMFIILGFLHSRAVRAIAGEATADTLKTCHTRHIRLPLPSEKTFNLCIQSLSFIGRYAMDEDRSQGRITVTSSINWKTWGDTITFDIKGTGKESTDVTVSSRPTSWMTIVDYGKNLDNVVRIISRLEKTASAASRN